MHMEGKIDVEKEINNKGLKKKNLRDKKTTHQT